MEPSSQLEETPARNVCVGVSRNVSFTNCMVQLLDTEATSERGGEFPHNEKQLPDERSLTQSGLHVMEMRQHTGGRYTSKWGQQRSNQRL